MRFIDDYMFGCSSFQEAESVVAGVRRAVNEFELELNSSKTQIRPSGPFYQTAWRDHIRSMLPTRPYHKEDLTRYFYNIHLTSQSNVSADVVKFSIQIARRAFLETDEWSMVEDYLLSAYRLSPTIVALLVELFILRFISKRDVSLDRVGAFVSARLSPLINAQKYGEVSWLLFLCISLRIPLKSNILAGLFDIQDGAIAVLLSDASQKGLVSGKIDQRGWNRSLTADGLDSSMWLYSYESTLKQLNGVTSEKHVTNHQYFGPIFAKKIEFYRSGSAHLNKVAHLSQLRMEHLRRRIQEKLVGEDLAEDLIDFGEYDDDELADEETDLY
jgi:hypothetical protein